MFFVEGILYSCILFFLIFQGTFQYRIVGDLPGQQYFDINDDGQVFVRYSPKDDPQETLTYTVCQYLTLKI